jgi:DNA-binding LacI/PurR family transcriptional regulator
MKILMPKKKTDITMKEIAKAIGVSQTTVSLTVRGKADAFGISQKTQKEILSHISRIGYVPDQDAADISKSGQRRIGILISNTMTENHKTIFFHLIRHIPSYDASPVISLCDETNFAESVRYLAGKKSQEIILIGEAIEYLRTVKDVSAVFENRRVYLVDYPFHETETEPKIFKNTVKIGIDRTKSYRLALTELGKLGHTKVASASHGYRYLERCASSGSLPMVLPINGPKIQTEDSLFFGKSLLQEVLLLYRENGCTAVMTGDDQTAIGLISAIHESGLRVPRDISVLGFDNILMADYSAVPLTTIEVPAQEMIDCLVSDLFSAAPRKQRYVLNGKVIWRKSVGPAKQ